MDAPLRFGLLGLGPRGQALAAAVRECPGVVLAAGAAGDEEGAGVGRGTWWGYATPEEVIAAPQIDVVLVANDDPASAHAHARAALAHGKPVLWFGYPAGLAQLDALVATAERHDAPLSLPNELRFLPATRALQSSVGQGDAGPLLSVFAAWRTRRALGDPLRELGLPLLDYLRWCLGEEVARAQVTAGPLFGADRPAALLILRARDGVALTVELAASLPADYEQEDELTIEVLGEAAALRAEPFNQAITVVGGAHRARMPWHRHAAYPLVESFVAALREDREPPGSPAELRPTYVLLEQLAAASADGEARALPPFPGGRVGEGGAAG